MRFSTYFVKHLSGFWSLKNNLLIAIVEQNIFAPVKFPIHTVGAKLLKTKKNQYFRILMTLVIICSNSSKVIPLILEFVVSQDGYKKLSSSKGSSKRWD